MAGSDSQPKKATPPRPAINAPRKPLQVMHISRKTEEEIADKFNDKRFNEEVLDEKKLSSLNFLSLDWLEISSSDDSF